MKTLFIAFALLLTACPKPAGNTEPVSKCSAVGQSCQYAEGKLGTCVAKEPPCDPGPDGHGCFVCQSQH